MNRRPSHPRALVIGGIPVRLFAPAPSAWDDDAVRYASFQAKALAADAVSVNVTFARFARRQRPVVVDGDPEGCTFSSESFRGRYARRQRRVDVRCAPLRGVVDQFLRVLYSVLLFEQKGFLIHAAGLAFRGRGLIFAGTSSSGKTTLVRRAGEAFGVLGDELVAVRREASGYRISATPFAGAWEGPVVAHSAPLEKIFLLDRHRDAVPLEVCVTTRSAGSSLALEEAVAALLRHVFFFLRSRETGQAMLELLLDCARRVPVRLVNPSGPLGVPGEASRGRH